MKRVLWLVAAGFSVSSIHAQTCPALNFLQGSTVTVFDSTSAAGLQRQVQTPARSIVAHKAQAIVCGVQLPQVKQAAGQVSRRLGYTG